MSRTSSRKQPNGVEGMMRMLERPSMSEERDQPPTHHGENVIYYSYQAPTSVEVATSARKGGPHSSSPDTDVKLISPPDDALLEEIPKLIVSDLFSSKMSDVEKGLQRLAHLCSIPDENAEKNRTEVYNCGGHAAIVGSLKKWFGCPEIQAEGFRAIHNTAISDVNFVNAVVKVGVIEVVLLAMRNFPDHQNVQVSGCGVLYALCYKGAPITESFVVENNGIPVVVAAMKRFPKKSLLQKWACGIFGLVSEIEDIKYRIQEEGGLEALVGAINMHKDEGKPYSADIQKKARLAMKRLI